MSTLDEARITHEALDAISRTRALTDGESLLLEAAQKRLERDRQERARERRVIGIG